MKRIVMFFLILCLSLSSAVAERGTMKLWDVDSASSFWRQHRDIQYERVVMSSWEDRLTGFQNNEVDVAILRLYHNEMAPFMEADVLVDLSQSEIISDAVSRMPQWIQEHVTTADGRIVAVPTMALVRPIYWYQDAWDAAGLTEADVPRSFTELLDFLDAWAMRIEEQPEKNVCVSRLMRMGTGKEKYDYIYWLIDMLLTTTEMQQRYANQSVTFNTPEFIELADRCRDTGLALYQAEPSKQKRQRMLQLFQSDLHGGEHANNGRAYGLSHSVPLRLTSDQPMLTWINMEVHVVNKSSSWISEGLALLESIMQNKPWYFKYAIYADFEAGDYGYDNGTTGHVDAGWLQDYHGYSGEFVFYPCAFNQVADGSTRKEALMTRFFAGEISAEVFAEGLDQIISGQK